MEITRDYSLENQKLFTLCLSIEDADDLLADRTLTIRHVSEKESVIFQIVKTGSRYTTHGNERQYLRKINGTDGVYQIIVPSCFYTSEGCIDWLLRLGKLSIASGKEGVFSYLQFRRQTE